ncbi:MAG TPA: enoyl-CoA hydratase-related protein [Dehalococcoidia bacterium]|nr:enoyl-CoA hydratase-related protein [Dehalococcoidia bacterium]
MSGSTIANGRSGLVELERDGRVAWVRLNRPEKLNALSRELVAALHGALAPFAGETGVAAIVLSGNGRCFSTGADVNLLRELDGTSGRAFITALHELMAAIRALPQIVIAAVHGYCFGGAAELAAACDLRIAADSARFGMPEIKVGLPSVIEAALFVPLVGLGRAADFVLTGDEWDAPTAERYGLVTRVVPAELLGAESTRLAQQIAGFSGPALRLQKELIRAWTGEAVDRAIERGIAVFARAYDTPNPREALDALRERRAPRFSVE